MLKLHLGCGNKRIDGYTNVDIQPGPAVDLVTDISKPLPFENGSVDVIYACHVLEHFSRHEWKSVLESWTSLLRRPGGVLRLAVPDFEVICQEYLRSVGSAQHAPANTFEIDKYVGLVLGGQKDRYDHHGMIFDARMLSSTLVDLGAKKVVEYDRSKTEHSSVDDYSNAHLPHMNFEYGTLMSLNLEATF